MKLTEIQIQVVHRIEQELKDCVNSFSRELETERDKSYFSRNSDKIDTLEKILGIRDDEGDAIEENGLIILSRNLQILSCSTLAVDSYSQYANQSLSFLSTRVIPKLKSMLSLSQKVFDIKRLMEGFKESLSQVVEAPPPPSVSLEQRDDIVSLARQFNEFSDSISLKIQDIETTLVAFGDRIHKLEDQLIHISREQDKMGDVSHRIRETDQLVTEAVTASAAHLFGSGAASSESSRVRVVEAEEVIETEENHNGR